VPLLLWDIDGTLLLKASLEHAEAIHAAIERVYGVAIPEGRVEAAGRTDFAIARSILTLAGVSAERVDERLGDLRAAAVEEYAHRVPADLSDRVAPHVPEVLC
jgi:phosphoglycolate phosphatase